MRRDQRGSLSYLLLMIAILQTKTLAQSVQRIQPIAFSLPSPPALIGPLSINNALTDSEKVHLNRIKGPTSLVNHDGHLYASTVDSKIYDLASCPPRLIVNLAPPGCVGKKQCGQLTSLRRDPTTGFLFVLDTFRGLFAVHPHTGTSKLVYSVRTPVNNRLPVHLNDMVISPEGVIIMSDSSDAYNIDNDVYICMDGRPTGRLLIRSPLNGFVSELLPGRFNYPNGLELTPEGDLLVAETCRATIHRVSLKRTSWLRVNPFTVNLPGLPDNIRSSGRGTYWVAMSYARHTSVSNPVDENSGIPRYRAMGARMMSLRDIKDLFTKWGIVVEIDPTGTIVGSLHDPTGTTLSMVTEVNEFGGVLNIGSHIINYMARFLLPPETGIKTSIDSFVQIKRSRCELPDSKVEATKQQLLQAQQNQTPSPLLPPEPLLTPKKL